ncbi:DUF6886 family protein [Actinoplanes sp. NPDC049265]|uniref:DUF6886 family protein n=1 Tax=Actinoplanes sp. NPDC049265 TaxID=3363902 RepID=UPI00371A4320
MLPDAGQVLHFSEDPTITVFRPHVAPTSRETEPYVWAVDGQNAPSYWFPRDCPRVCSWPRPDATGARVHAIEYAWLDRLRTVRLFAYRFPAGQFRPIGKPYPHAWVSTEVVRPLGPPEETGDLLAAHEAAGIELRLLRHLRPYMDSVVASGLRFSGIRLRNAARSG